MQKKRADIPNPSPNTTNSRIAYANMGLSGFTNLVTDLNTYFSSNPLEAVEFAKEIDFINNRLSEIPPESKILYTILPYQFIFEYDYNKVEVFRDEAAGMFYVYLDGKKLYYHKGFTNAVEVQKSFTYISAEQHPDSPHRYINDFFKIDENDTVADLGAAEGNFSLMVIDKIKQLIIVEADQIWMEALHKTFEPWKNKVKIINKFVGEKDDAKTITLKNIQGDEKITTIKMDIEGAEISVLENAQLLLRSNNIKMAITTYHRHADAENIKLILEKNNYRTEFSDGFLLFVYSILQPPFFRKGLIRAKYQDDE